MVLALLLQVIIGVVAAETIVFNIVEYTAIGPARVAEWGSHTGYYIDDNGWGGSRFYVSGNSGTNGTFEHTVTIGSETIHTAYLTTEGTTRTGFSRSACSFIAAFGSPINPESTINRGWCSETTTMRMTFNDPRTRSSFPPSILTYEYSTYYWVLLDRDDPYDGRSIYKATLTFERNWEGRETRSSLPKDQAYGLGESTLIASSVETASSSGTGVVATSTGGAMSARPSASVSRAGGPLATGGVLSAEGAGECLRVPRASWVMFVGLVVGIGLQ